MIRENGLKIKKNKVVLVTGASSGIGKAVAMALNERGCIVYAVARHVDALEDLGQEGIRIMYMDVTKDKSIRRVIKCIAKEEGRIDILINNAGYGAYGMLENVPIEEAKKQFDVNLFGMARVNNHVLPMMRHQRSGRIIMVASSASHIATLGSGWYSASKHAVKALAEALRMEIMGFHIDVIQIEPGPIQTGFEEKAKTTFGKAKKRRDYMQLDRGFQRYVKKMYKKSPSPDSTVKQIVKASLSRSPKWVYRTTKSSVWLPYIKQFLGLRIYTKMVTLLFRFYGR